MQLLEAVQHHQGLTHQQEATADQVRKERPGIERASKPGLVKIHGTHRGVVLVEFLDVPWG